MEDLRESSMRFFSDQSLCYADILSPSEVTISSSSLIILFGLVQIRNFLVQVRARIEVTVLNFLRILTAPAPAISDLSLVLLSVIQYLTSLCCLISISFALLLRNLRKGERKIEFRKCLGFHFSVHFLSNQKDIKLEFFCQLFDRSVETRAIAE